MPLPGFQWLYRWRRERTDSWRLPFALFGLQRLCPWWCWRWLEGELSMYHAFSGREVVCLQHPSRLFSDLSFFCFCQVYILLFFSFFAYFDRLSWLMELKCLPIPPNYTPFSLKGTLFCWLAFLFVWGSPSLDWWESDGRVIRLSCPRVLYLLLWPLAVRCPP